MRTSPPKKKTNQARGGKKGDSQSSRTASTDAGDQKDSTESGHTPGPWCAMDHCIIGSDAEDIGLVYGNSGIEGPKSYRWEANARLIAAAPDLLTAAKGLLRLYTVAGKLNDVTALFTAARAAIAKAEGKG